MNRDFKEEIKGIKQACLWRDTELADEFLLLTLEMIFQQGIKDELSRNIKEL